MFHFQQLLEKNPGHYSALHKLILLLKRAGKLTDAPRFIKLAERSSPRAESDPGLKFCKVRPFTRVHRNRSTLLLPRLQGVYARHSNDHHEAIRLLNQVRFSGEWGLLATENMVEIYLNPESPDLWSEDDNGEAAAAAKDNSEACRVADKLLRDIPSASKVPRAVCGVCCPLFPAVTCCSLIVQTTRHQVLEAYVLIVSKNRVNLEQAVQQLGAILADNSNDVRALLALATALMVLKQTPKVGVRVCFACAVREHVNLSAFLPVAVHLAVRLCSRSLNPHNRTGPKPVEANRENAVQLRTC